MYSATEKWEIFLSLVFNGEVLVKVNYDTPILQLEIQSAFWVQCLNSHICNSFNHFKARGFITGLHKFRKVRIFKIFSKKCFSFTVHNNITEQFQEILRHQQSWSFYPRGLCAWCGTSRMFTGEIACDI